LKNFFHDATSPGLLVYSEYVAANLSPGRAASEVVESETERARNLAAEICPPDEFFTIRAAIDDSTDYTRTTPLVDAFLSALESARVPHYDALALHFLPPEAFGGACAARTTLVTSASQAIEKFSPPQGNLLHRYLGSRISRLSEDHALRTKYPHTLLAR
jgi:hypothetical protein